MAKLILDSENFTVNPGLQDCIFCPLRDLSCCLEFFEAVFGLTCNNVKVEPKSNYKLHGFKIED